MLFKDLPRYAGFARKYIPELGDKLFHIKEFIYKNELDEFFSEFYISFNVIEF